MAKDIIRLLVILFLAMKILGAYQAGYVVIEVEEGSFTTLPCHPPNHSNTTPVDVRWAIKSEGGGGDGWDQIASFSTRHGREDNPNINIRRKIHPVHHISVSRTDGSITLPPLKEGERLLLRCKGVFINQHQEQTMFSFKEVSVIAIQNAWVLPFVIALTVLAFLIVIIIIVVMVLRKRRKAKYEMEKKGSDESPETQPLGTSITEIIDSENNRIDEEAEVICVDDNTMEKKPLNDENVSTDSIQYAELDVHNSNNHNPDVDTNQSPKHNNINSTEPPTEYADIEFNNEDH